VVHELATVRAQVAGVELLVVAVPLEVSAIRGTGIDITDPFVVREEKNAIANPARAGEVAVQADKRAKGT
jgi:hypothetical protein